MVFTGNDAEEYKRICDNPNIEALEQSQKFDEWFNKHSTITFGQNGETVIETDLIKWDNIPEFSSSSKS